MKYIIIFKPDMFKEGTIEHIIQADGVELEGDFIILFRQGTYSKARISMYRSENVIYAGLYEQAPAKTGVTFSVQREEN